MSGKKSERDKIIRDIDSLFSWEKPRKGTAADYFYEHLTGLLKYYLATMESNEDERLKLSKKTYSELEQFALENSGIFEYEENGETDWDLIDDAKDIFKVGLAGAVGKEIHSDYLRPFVRSVSDSYENWLIYDLMYPGSVFNPWNSLLNLLKDGCIYLISDNKDVLTEYVRDIYEKTDKEHCGNIAFIGWKEKKFSGFLSDSRHNSQIAVYQFLKQYAAGSQNANNMESIRIFLSKYESRHVGKEELQSAILYPLKNCGLIGSCSKGFFHITAPENLRCALNFHCCGKISEEEKRMITKSSEEDYYKDNRSFHPSITKKLEKNYYQDNKYSHPYHNYFNIPLPLSYSQKKERRKCYA
jgi:hypothetical protein